MWCCGVVCFAVWLVYYLLKFICDWLLYCWFGWLFGVYLIYVCLLFGLLFWWGWLVVLFVVYFA